MRVNLSDFWRIFSYSKAKKFDDLHNETVEMLANISDKETAVSLFYPNAFSFIAMLSSKSSVRERTITKNGLISFLREQKTLLINKWTLHAYDREQLLRTKKLHLSSSFSSNADVRTFVFTDAFLERNADHVIAFIHEYLNKYFKKPRLQKPPIFVFGNQYSAIMQSALLELYKYQRPVNTGLVGNVFIVDSFINNTNCPSDFVCKMAMLQHITVDILEQCRVNQVYIVGKCDVPLQSVNYNIEELDITDINILRYLIALSKTLEV